MEARMAIVLVGGGRDVGAWLSSVAPLVTDAGEARLAVVDANAGPAAIAALRAAAPAVPMLVLVGEGGCDLAVVAGAAGPAERVSYLFAPYTRADVVALATRLIVREASPSHDPLTGALDREAFRRALDARASRPGGHAVAIVDIDRFRLVNDIFGHAAGDVLLTKVAAVLADQAPDGAILARLGADEFGLLFDAPGAIPAAMACERLVHACRATFDLGGQEVEGAACVGVAVNEPGVAPDDLLRRADLALGDAKSQGRNHVCLFDDSLDEALRVRHRIEHGLADALAGGELAMAFQPIVTRQGHEIVGFEALLRWHTDEFGAISPATFVPIAEESNLIHALGDWVLETSLAAVSAWPGQYVSVNFSPRQFRRPNFVGYIVERCARAGVAPERLQIEITETAIFDDVDHAAETLYRLRQMGFRIALDDFGTGYSSLYNVRKFPLDALKIDPSFVGAMGREREAAAVVQAVIHLAQALGLSVVAEGVETQAQVDLLHLAGVTHLQGFAFAPAVNGTDAALLAAQRFLEDRVSSLVA
jgi:diguanylate cyclase (GGDEF)-like protein